VARGLSGALRRHRARTVAIPLGLFHSDHQITHEAARGLLRHSKGERWIAYEDALYRRIPGLVAGRLAELERAGYRISPHEASCDSHACLRKRRAVACYASQLRGLASAGRPGHADLAAPERYWRLSP
jgi:LmbE family N-acetylglucosaminyl deacetylase